MIGILVWEKITILVALPFFPSLEQGPVEPIQGWHGGEVTAG